MGRLTKQKMMTINEVIHSQLFLFPKSRKILLPLITNQVKMLFEAKEEVSRYCVLNSLYASCTLHKFPDAV